MRQWHVCACRFPGISQSNFGTLSGSVSDAQSQPVSDARVAVRAKATLVRTVSVTHDGFFEVPGLTPGDYTVEVRANGFAPQDQAARLEVASRCGWISR